MTDVLGHSVARSQLAPMRLRGTARHGGSAMGRARHQALWVAAATLIGLVAGLPAAPRASAATVPEAPGEVVADADDGAVTVSWDPAWDAGSPITSYVVLWGADGGAVTPTTVPGDVRTATFTGLTNGASYRACVYAVNAVGRSAGCHTSGDVRPGVPDAPGDMWLTDGPTGLQRVAWSPADGNGFVPTRYDITSNAGWTRSIDARAWDASPPEPQGADHYWLDVHGLAAGVDYSFRVSATNQFGTSSPSELTFRLDRSEHLWPGQVMPPGKVLRSPNGRYALEMQRDGNVVVYSSGSRALWDSRTWGRPGAELRLQRDGNLVLYGSDGQASWSTGTWGRAAGRLTLQDDGNLVLYAADGAVMWFSGWDLGVPAVPDTLWSTQQLTPGQSLVSRNGRYAATMQGDGDLVVQAPVRRPLWDTRTHGSGDMRLVLQPDGNLVVYDAGRAALWDSATWDNPGARLVMQNDGNLVLYNASGLPLWSSGWDPGAGVARDTLSATQQLTTGQSLVSRDGKNTLVMQADGNLVLYGPGRQPRWSTNSWNGLRSRLTLQPDGNAVLYTPGGPPLWDSRTWGNANVRMVVQDDGNLVVYAANGRALWSSMFGRTY
jgi:hypothetical protein